MQARVRVVEGHDIQAELVSLRRWLTSEDELRGRVTLDQPLLTPGQMGALADVLLVALGGGGAGTVLAHSLRVWLSQRRGDVTIEVSTPDGRSVKLAAKGVADVTQLIREVLGNSDDHGNTGA
ncbi:MAG: effector-associated constant component EACC1 [Pseudonocardiaceae bacterium]